MQTIIHSIGEKHQLGISSINRLAGGDINDVFLLKCTSESFVLKLNLDAKFPGMFEAEAKGLETASLFSELPNSEEYTIGGSVELNILIY